MRVRTSSFLQSQKLESNSRSSSGVNRSEENVVRVGVSEALSVATVDRFFFADFMAILPRKRVSLPGSIFEQGEDGSLAAQQLCFRDHLFA